MNDPKFLMPIFCVKIRFKYNSVQRFSATTLIHVGGNADFTKRRFLNQQLTATRNSSSLELIQAIIRTLKFIQLIRMQLLLYPWIYGFCWGNEVPRKVGLAHMRIKLKHKYNKFNKFEI